MKLNNIVKITVATLTMALSAQSMALSPLEIMNKVDARDDGSSMVGTMKMILIDKKGKKRIRTMKSFAKDVDAYTEHKSIFFLSPSDVKNTAFLNYDYANPNKEDDQWMYLPALKKTKRIPTSDKDSSFMGSDFTYSDMTKRIVSDYDYALIKESKIQRKSGSVPVWIISATPKTKKTLDETGYTKSIVYVRKDNFLVTRAKLYLKNSKKIKYMDVKEIKEINGILVPTKTTMTTKMGKTTTHKSFIGMTEIVMNGEIDENVFTIRAIEKGL